MSRRSRLRLLALALALPALLQPARAWAGSCNNNGFLADFGACIDVAQYNIWFGLAGTLWSIDRVLLLLAYQLAALRVWIVKTAFAGAYNVLTQLVNPLIVPAATVALILGCLAFLLLPLIGRTSLINIRQVLVWALLAPMVLTLSGPLLAQVDQARVEVGAALFAGASAIAPGAIFGASANDMRAPRPLYPSNACGAPLVRAGSDATVQVDDLAAALLWADAQDIHCPEQVGPGRTVPDAFYITEPGGPGYAYNGDLGSEDNRSTRAQALDNIQRGIVRLVLGLLPSCLAVLDALVHLVFSLGLVAVWIGIPIALVFLFFQQTAAGLTGLLRRAVSVLQVSWSASFLLGIVFACLRTAAETGNATAYAGFAIGAIILTGYMLFVAVDTLKASLKTLTDTVAAATGLSLTKPFELAGQAAGAAVGAGATLATGGAALAMTAAAAYRQTGSGRYAAAAAAGRIRPLAQLGEVAAMMGYQDEEVVSGLHAGQQSAQHLRAGRLRMKEDAQKTDAHGLTMRDRARERALARQLERDRARNAGPPPTAAGDPEADPHHREQPMPAASRPAAGHPGTNGQGPQSDELAQELADRNDRTMASVRANWRDAVAAIPVDAAHRPTAHRYTAMSLDQRGRLHYHAGLTPDRLPAEALTEPHKHVVVPRLLVLGYTVQNNGDGTVTFWKPQPLPPPAPTDERRRPLRASRPDPAHGAAPAPPAAPRTSTPEGDAAHPTAAARPSPARPSRPRRPHPAAAPVAPARQGRKLPTKKRGKDSR
jgi:hypothetical protein